MVIYIIWRKKKMTEEEKIVQEIAKQKILAIKRRGDLETRSNDEEDFFEVSVWELKEALLEIYNAGKNNR